MALLDDGIDASVGEVGFCDAGTLLGSVVRVWSREGRTHEVLDEIVYALVVREPRARISVRACSWVSQKDTTRAIRTSGPVMSQ